MSQKKCGFGFSCASMMQQPGLEPKDCLNWETCGKVQEYEPYELVELRRVQTVERQRVHVTFRISRHQAAIRMLRERGNHQQLADFGIEEQKEHLEQQLAALLETLEPLTQDYVAPEGVKAHLYNVKRPGQVVTDEEGNEIHYPRIYWYNKMTATSAIFEPSEEDRMVRVIHLSHNHDPRNIEARLGIERRDRLLKIQEQLRVAEAALAEATAIAEAPMNDVITELEERRQQLEQEIHGDAQNAVTVAAE